MESKIIKLDWERLPTLLWHWKWLIVVCALVPASVALALSLLSQPSFEAQAAVAIIKSSTQLVLDSRIRTTTEADSLTYSDPTSRQKFLVQVVNNAEIAIAVIAQMGDQLPVAQQNPNVLVRSISASNNGDVILIKAKARTPQSAATLANLWAQEYETRVNALYTGSELTPTELQAKADAAKKEYDTSEAALTMYLANNPIGLLSQQIAETQKTIAAYQDAQLTAITDVYALQTKLDRLIADATALRARMAAENRFATMGSELAMLFLEVNAFNTSLDLPANTQGTNSSIGLNTSSSLQITLPQLNSGTSSADQIARLDPLISLLQDRRKAMQATADARAKGLVSPASLDSLRQSIDQLINQANQLQSQLELENAKKQELVRARDLSLNSYTALAAQVTANQAVARDRGSLVRFVVPASVPLEAGWSRSVLNILLALAVGLGAGVVLAFAFEMLDRRVRDESAVTQYLGLPTLGTVPDWTSQIAKTGHSVPALAVLNPDLSASAMISFLHHNLMTDNRAGQVLAVTSATPGEGKSTIAANLAVQCAQTGQTVLLVDADLHRPILHRLFAIDNTHGLTDTLNGTAKEWQTLAQATTIPGLKLMPSGHLSSDSTIWLDRPEWAHWLQEAKQTVDIIIVDTPATLGVPDSAIIARCADAILLVVAADRGSQKIIVRARDQLAAMRVPIVGVVLNRVALTATTLPFWNYYKSSVGSANGRG